MAEGEQGQPPPFPFGEELQLEVAKIEPEPREWSKGQKGDEDYKEAKIWKVGVVAPNGAKVWAELFVWSDQPDPAPGKVSGKVVPTDREDWLPKLEIKRQRRGGRGGGGWKADPVEEAARQAMIVHQHSQSATIAELELASKLGLRGAGFEGVEALRSDLDGRSRTLTEAAINAGNAERTRAKARKANGS